MQKQQLNRALLEAYAAVDESLFILAWELKRLRLILEPLVQYHDPENSQG